MKLKTSFIFGIFSIVFLSACGILPSAIGPAASPLTSPGQIAFVATDKLVNASATLKSAMITISEIDLHNQAGWTQIFPTVNTVDLITLKDGSLKLLSSLNLSSGNYDQIKLIITSATVTDSNGIAQAKIPSNSITINAPVVINANQTSSVKFDFRTDQSVHLTGSGMYIFAPVIHLVSTSASNVSSPDANGKVSIMGGSLVQDTIQGMDVNGNFGPGLSIPDANISIDNTGKIVQR